MFGSDTGRHLVAAFAALLMSVVAVGSAVAPAAVQTQAVAVNA